MKTLAGTLDCLVVGRRTYNKLPHSAEDVKPFVVSVVATLRLSVNDRRVGVRVAGNLYGLTLTKDGGGPFNLTRLCPVNLRIVECVESRSLRVIGFDPCAATRIIKETVQAAQKMTVEYSMPKSPRGMEPEKFSAN